MRSPTKLWRLFRHWKPLIYFILLILLIQALIAFHTNPNLLEEEKLRLMKEAHIKRKNELAKQLFVEKLSNDERGLGDTDKENNLNLKIQERFVRGAKSNILEDNDKQNFKPNEAPVSRIVERRSDVVFKPRCEVAHKDALSALSRATTNACKQEIADNACSLQNGTLFPKSIPRYCTHENKYAGVAPIPASYEENAERVRICYMLVVHGRAVRQFFRLFKAIYHQDHFYYIHVDLRSDHLLREIQPLTEKFKNVKIAPWRMATIWGGSSLLQMLLRAMTDVVQSWSQWDFFINLSALDFPIETQEKLVNYLTAYKDKNFMKSHGRDDEKFIRKQGLNRLFVECENHMWRLGERTLPDGITMNGGSDWVALDRDFCEYIINGDDQLLKDLKHWYKYTLLPAESFFHTLAQNSLKCESFVDNNLRVTNWNRARGCKCQYKHIVDWCGCSPNDFFPSDLARLQTSRPVFFARKFEEIINQEVMNHLDFKLHGEYPPGTPSINSLWENCYDHLDKPEATGDAFLTHYTSFARIGLSKINPPMNEDSRSEECSLSLSKVQQVEVYKYKEEFKGYVVTFEADWQNSKHPSIKDRKKILLQSIVYNNPSLQILDHTSTLAKRLEHAAVGTNWDVKELVLRDWGGIIGPLSEPRLVAKWRSAPNDFIVTVVLIDPLNVVADYNDFRTPNNAAGVTDTPLSIRKPLRPGKWTVRFYVQRQFQKAVATLSFVVVPLQFQKSLKNKYNLTASNRGVSADDQLNSAGRNLYSIKTTLNLPRYEGAEKSLEERSTYVGEDLESWIDEVVDLGWTVDSVCIAGSDIDLSVNSIIPPSCVSRFKFIPKLCKTLPWSSYFPDPKSEIGPVQRNGRIR